MTRIVRSPDTIGYRVIAPGRLLPIPGRVFALPEGEKYNLYLYVWKDPIALALGFPSDILKIEEARTEQEARSKLVSFLTREEENIEKLEEYIP